MRWIITKAFDQLDPSHEPVEDVTDFAIGRFQVYEGGITKTMGFLGRDKIESWAAAQPYTFRIYTTLGYLAYEGKADDSTSVDALLPRTWAEEFTACACRIDYLRNTGEWATIQ